MMDDLPDPASRFEDVERRLADCGKWDESISLAALGEEEPPAHAGSCGSCAEILEDRRAVLRMLAKLPTSYAKFPSRRRWWPWAAAAAVLIVAIWPRPRLHEPVRTTMTAPVPPPTARTLPDIRALGALLDRERDSARRHEAVRLLVHARSAAAQEELLRARPDAEVIAGLRDIGAVDRLLEYLEIPALEALAAAALARLRDPRAIPALVRKLPRTARVLREFGASLEVYARANPDPALLSVEDPLVTLALLEDETIRARLDPEIVASAARRMATDRRRAPRLAKLLPPSEEFAEFFRGALKVADARIDACRALARIRYRPAVPDLIATLRHEPEAARALAAITGENYGGDREAWLRWWKSTGRKL